MEDALMEDYVPLSLLSDEEQSNLDDIFNETNGLEGLEGIEYQLAQKRLIAADQDDLDTYLTVLSQESQSWMSQLY